MQLKSKSLKGERIMGMTINIWNENIDLLSNLCKKEGITWTTKLLAKDCDGELLYAFQMDRPLSRKSQLEYQEKRTRK